MFLCYTKDNVLIDIIPEGEKLKVKIKPAESVEELSSAPEPEEIEDQEEPDEYEEVEPDEEELGVEEVEVSGA